MPSGFDAPALLRALFRAAIDAADPIQAVPAALPPRPDGRVAIIGAGRAALRMAEAALAAWGPCEGMILTPQGSGAPLSGLTVIEAGTDAAALAGTRRLLDLLAGMGAGDTVLGLVSAGASALLAAPIEGITLADRRALETALATAGAPRAQLALVRKHLSRIAGGRLAAAAAPARMLTLVLADGAVTDTGVIGDGATQGETSTPEDAQRILDQWWIDAPAHLRAALARAAPPPGPDDPALAQATTRIIGTPTQALAAATDAALAAGCRVEILGTRIEGEAVKLAQEHAQLVRRTRLAPGSAPLVLLSAGALSTGDLGAQQGLGGPNAEYALALGMALEGRENVWAIACDTDGIDGTAPAAGALIGPDFGQRIAQAGLNPRRALATHDAHGFFAAIGGQVVTGPTHANVADFRAILILPAPRP